LKRFLDYFYSNMLYELENWKKIKKKSWMNWTDRVFIFVYKVQAHLRSPPVAVGFALISKYYFFSYQWWYIFLCKIKYINLCKILINKPKCLDVIMFVSDLRQVGCFIWVLLFSFTNTFVESCAKRHNPLRLKRRYLT
jgi:hypothetical protein